MSTAVTVTLRSVTKHFGEEMLFENVSFTFPAGVITAIIGESGSGKTTLLRLIAGLEEAENSDSISIGEKRPARYCKEQGVGYVCQEPALLPWRTAKGNVKVPLELRKMGNGDQRERSAIAALKRTGLAHSANGRLAMKLSGGMKQRVALARAFIFQPGLVLLDEPFSSLDEPSREELCLRLREDWLSAGRPTVIVVTHDLQEAAFLADRYVFMRKPSKQTLASDTSPLKETRNFESAEVLAERHRLKMRYHDLCKESFVSVA